MTRYWSQTGDFPFEVVEPASDVLRLAGATKPCQCVGHDQAPAAGECTICRSTGRVYLFPDDVRLICQRLTCKMGCECCQVSLTCLACPGRGWTPATDGWVWWRAARMLFDRLIFSYDYGGWFTFSTWTVDEGFGDISEAKDDDPETAFFAALVRAVEAMPDVQL